jgi:hypothetical protein
MVAGRAELPATAERADADETVAPVSHQPHDQRGRRFASDDPQSESPPAVRLGSAATGHSPPRAQRIERCAVTQTRFHTQCVSIRPIAADEAVHSDETVAWSHRWGFATNFAYRADR